MMMTSMILIVQRSRGGQNVYQSSSEPGTYRIQVQRALYTLKSSFSSHSRRFVQAVIANKPITFRGEYNFHTAVREVSAWGHLFRFCPEHYETLWAEESGFGCVKAAAYKSNYVRKNPTTNQFRRTFPWFYSVAEEKVRRFHAPLDSHVCSPSCTAIGSAIRVILKCNLINL